MHQILGDFIDAFPTNQNSLELSFTSNAEDVETLWENQRLSAYFLANCFINFLPLNEDDLAQKQRIKEAKSAISYVANELIENAIKFNLKTSNYQVKLGIRFLEKPELIAAIFATNSLDNAGAEKFKTFIDILLASDPQEFYIQQIEASAQDENSDMSGLGLLTMINDYEAQLGWKFESLATVSGSMADYMADGTADCMADNIIVVTVMAQILV